MNMKHFFKAMGAFMAIIALGLIGFFLVSYFEQHEKSAQAVVHQIKVAK